MGVMKKLMNYFGIHDEEEQGEREPFNEEEVQPQQNVRRNRANVVSIHSQKNVKLVLLEPRSYEEAQEIADHLRYKRPVLINLQRVRKEQAVRIVDFLSGTVYALDGQIEKVGPNIFVCTPEAVEMEGTITEMLDEESNS